MSKKFGRYQHHVDYASVAANELKLRYGIVVPEGINEYGMMLEIDAATEEQFHRARKTKSLNKDRTDFLHTSVQNGKTVDQAVAEWREYVAKSLETKHIENI